MSDESILLIGSSRASRDAEEALVGSFPITLRDSATEAQSQIVAGQYSVIVVDADASPEPPWRVVEMLRERDENAAILLMVTPDTPWSSFASYRQRPAGLVLKPLDRSTLLMAIDSALVYRRLLEENRTLKRQLGSAVSLRDWVGCTPQSGEVRKSIATAALSTGSVLLSGEDGTGRRLAAELLHRHGRNPGSTFLPLDLTSVPAGDLRRLLEEVTEASVAGGGDYIHGARPGTLYLGELTTLDAVDQMSLRSFLEKPLPFRIVGSAKPSLSELVRQGRFDENAFRAISRITIRIPALRERRGDVPLLVDHFLKRFSERFGLKPLGIPSSAIENYSNYDWPGNVAELAMLIERAVSIASAAKFDGTTLPEHFCAPPSLTVPEPIRLKNVSLRELIADIEKRIILQTLERVDGSQKRAAQELRLNPTTLHEKMKRYKILAPARRQRI
ncbi:MAG TPA: helix-turn-helix domain-containing protein [Vicinamibacteria bacterium]|nr:helix-turn-helix domain-containing protein [Vicinamibacteria bacterium]